MVATGRSKAGHIVKRGAGGKFAGSVGQVSGRQSGLRAGGPVGQGVLARGKMSLGKARAAYESSVHTYRGLSPNSGYIGGALTRSKLAAQNWKKEPQYRAYAAIQNRAVARVISENKASKLKARRQG